MESTEQTPPTEETPPTDDTLPTEETRETPKDQTALGEPGEQLEPVVVTGEANAAQSEAARESAPGSQPDPAGSVPQEGVEQLVARIAFLEALQKHYEEYIKQLRSIMRRCGVGVPDMPPFQPPQ